MISFVAQVVDAQWESLETGFSGKLESVFFTSIDTGFIAGGSTILRTLDGGRTWSSKVLSEGVDQTINAVFFPTKAVGYAAGKIVYKTTDAGASWDSIYVISAVPSAKEFRSMYFKDELNGYVAGDGIRITSDGGNTWSVQPFHPAFPVSCNSIDFVGERLGFIGGWTGTSGGMFGIVAQTTDWGKTWRRSLAMEDISYGLRIRAVKFLTPQKGWVIGSRESSNPPYGETRILQTTDGGGTWESISTVFAQTLNAVAVASEQVCYIGDDWGRMFSTTDGGISWSRDELPAGGRSINSIVVAGGIVAYAVGDDGLAVKRNIVTSIKSASTELGFRISPNPSHGRVTISIDHSGAGREINRITIFDALGRGVHHSLNSTDEIEFDFSFYPIGVYYVQLFNGTSSHALKLLLN